MLATMFARKPLPSKLPYRPHDNHSAAGVHKGDSAKSTDTFSGGQYLGELSSVADAEREGVLLAMKYTRCHPAKTLCILTDSMTAVNTTLNIGNREHHRSGIESDIGAALKDPPSTMAIAWIRGHIGIPGYTQADRQALFHSLPPRKSLPPSQSSHPRRHQDIL